MEKIKTGRAKESDIKTGTKYPWGKLKKRLDYFVWPIEKDAARIRAAAANLAFKISARVIDGELRVIRK